MIRTRNYLLMLVTGAILASSAVMGARAQERREGKLRVDIQSTYTPSGWMGDGEYGRKYIDFSRADHANPRVRPNSIKITYKFGPTRWGGIYWQNQPDNWGGMPGNNYSGKGLSRVTFWARGEHGGEALEFKVGGINNKSKQYRDSLIVTTGRLVLSKDWKLYTIDLTSADLSSVIGAFCWIASSDYNQSQQITFFLDDLILE